MTKIPYLIMPLYWLLASKNRNYEHTVTFVGIVL